MSPVNGAMTEKELQASLVRAAKTFGWRVYFTWRSLHSPKGFPDLCMVRGDRLIFAELKTDKGKVTPDQQAWQDDLRAFGKCEVHLWRPSDLESAYQVLM